MHRPAFVEPPALTAQCLQVEGAVFDDMLDGHHNTRHHASGTRQLCIQLVADLQCRMVVASTLHVNGRIWMQVTLPYTAKCADAPDQFV